VSATKIASMGIVRTFRERLLSGFSWTVLSAVAMQGAVLLSTILVARILGLEAFGAYAVLASTVMTISAMAQGGTGVLATKYVAERAAEPAKVAQLLNMCRVTTSVMGVVTAALVFATAGVLSTTVLNRPELEPAIRLLSLAALFQVSVSYQVGALQGFGAFRELSKAGALAGVAHIACTAVGAWFGQTSGALIGFVIASALRAAAYRRALSGVRRAHGVPDDAPFDRKDFGLIWRFALPAGLAGLVTLPCLWLVTVLVARQPNGLALVALFSVAHQVRLAALQFPLLLNAVSFSVLSRLKGIDETDRYREVFKSNLAANLAFTALIVTMLILAANPVLGLYGSDFSSGRTILVVLMISILPEVLAATCYQLIQSAGHMWHSLVMIAIPRDLLYLMMAGFCLPAFGVTGAAFAYLIAQTAGLGLTLLTVWFVGGTATRPHAARR